MLRRNERIIMTKQMSQPRQMTQLIQIDGVSYMDALRHWKKHGYPINIAERFTWGKMPSKIIVNGVIDLTFPLEPFIYNGHIYLRKRHVYKDVEEKVYLREEAWTDSRNSEPIGVIWELYESTDKGEEILKLHKFNDTVVLRATTVETPLVRYGNTDQIC